MAFALNAIRDGLCIGRHLSKLYEKASGLETLMVRNREGSLHQSEPSARPFVLLSPACASFDQFSDFEARGDAFRAAVSGLPGTRSDLEQGSIGPGVAP